MNLSKVVHTQGPSIILGAQKYKDGIMTMLCCTSIVELLQYLAHRCVHVNLINQTPHRQQRLFWEIIPASATEKQAPVFHNLLYTGKCICMHTQTQPLYIHTKKISYIYVAHYSQKDMTSNNRLLFLCRKKPHQNPV